MAGPVASASCVIDVSHHLLYVQDAGSQPPPLLTPSNGLTASGKGIVVVFTGIASGLVRVVVEVHEDPPPDPQLDEWDEVVETALVAPLGRIVVRGPMSDPPPNLPNLARQGAGQYRLRVYARGRDIAPDTATLDPIEDYQLAIWPSADTQETIFKNSDRFGAGLRQLPGQQ